MTLSMLGIAPRYFLEVARTGSVSLAAEQLHVATSAVSRQISKLEDSLGCLLFERKARGMNLSEAGERLAAYLRHALHDTDRVLEEVKGLGGQRASRVRVACTEGLAIGFMPQAMHSFRQANPQCTVHLHVGTPDEVSHRLLRGEADIGLKFSVTPEKNLTLAHQQPAPIHLLMAPFHPLATRKSVTLADIVRYPLALPEPGATVRQMLDLCCSLQGRHYDTAYTGNNYATLLSLAAQGEVLTLSAVVSAAYAINVGTVVAVPVNEAQFKQRSLQVLTLASSPAESQNSQFVAHLINAALAMA